MHLFEIFIKTVARMYPSIYAFHKKNHEGTSSSNRIKGGYLTILVT
jgi:hypothetical protein